MNREEGKEGGREEDEGSEEKEIKGRNEQRGGEGRREGGGRESKEKEIKGRNSRERKYREVVWKSQQVPQNAGHRIIVN